MQVLLITIFIMLLLISVVAGVLKTLPISKSKPLLARLEVWYRWCWHNGQELVGIPLALLVFWWSGPVLRWLEPNSAIYDAGVLQGITVVVCHLLVANSMARAGARINITWFERNTSKSLVSRERLFVLYFIGYCILAALV